MSHSEWITVGALADGFAPEAFLLPDADLAGKTFTLNFSNGWCIEHHFGQEQLQWNAVDGSFAGSAANYRATAIRPDLYFVDFLKNEDGQDWSASLILDVQAGTFTAVLGCLPDADALKTGLYARARASQPLTQVEAQFIHGTLAKPWQDGACPHAPTRDLIGLRNRYRYSPTEVYEHIYLNENFYTWQCLQGVEKGLADTDLCHYYKIADQLYLFVWREKIVPTLGVVLIDLQQHRSDGKICGYADDSLTQLANFRMASHCEVLNSTDYGDVQA